VLVLPLVVSMLSICRSLQPVGIEESLSLETLELDDNFQEGRHWEDTRYGATDSTGANSHPSRPFSQWQCLTPRGVPTELQLQLQTRPAPKTVAVARSSTTELTRFQRFIRRMECAGPKVILDRLKEDWQETTSEEADDEVCSSIRLFRNSLLILFQLALEKQLWLLTGFQMQNLGREKITPEPECNTGRILELYGNLCKLMLCPCVTLSCIL
jgi:hypothetical protein